MIWIGIFLVVNGLLDLQLGTTHKSSITSLLGVAGVVLGVLVLTGTVH